MVDAPLGRSGRGMKLTMNVMAKPQASDCSKARSVAVKSGLIPRFARDVMGLSRMGCGLLDWFLSAALADNTDAHRVAIANAATDMRCLPDMALAAEVMNPVGAAVRHSFNKVDTAGKGHDYLPTIAPLIATLNECDLPAAARTGAG